VNVSGCENVSDVMLGVSVRISGDSSEFESSATVVAFSQVDVPPVGISDLGDNAQPEAGAAGSGRVTRIEHLLAGVSGDPDAVIFDVEPI